MTRPMIEAARAQRRWRTRVSGLLIATALVLSVAPTAQAATATNAYLAKVGTSGANGTATVTAFTTGVGNVVLKLKKLAASRTLAVTLLKTSCKGTTLMTLASVKTTSTGAVTRTSSLTAAQVTAIKKATTGPAKIAIRIGTGTTAKCGVFVVQLVPAYVAAKVTVGPSPSGVAIDASGIWVTNWWDNTLSKINPATNTVLSVIPLLVPDQEGPEALVFGAGSLWVTTTEFDAAGAALPGTLFRVDPGTGAVQASIPIGKGAFDIAFGGGSVWVVNAWDGNVQRIDPATNTIVATISDLGALSVAADATAAWVVNVGGSVKRIDLATNQVVATVFTQTTAAFVAIGGGAVWVTNQGDEGLANGTLSRIDPATNLVVANIPIGEYPVQLAVAGGSVWIGLQGTETTVVRVNIATNKVLSRTQVGAKVYDIAATTGQVWSVANLAVPEGGTEPPNGYVTRIGY